MSSKKANTEVVERLGVFWSSYEEREEKLSPETQQMLGSDTQFVVEGKTVKNKKSKQSYRTILAASSISREEARLAAIRQLNAPERTGQSYSGSGYTVRVDLISFLFTTNIR